MDPELDVAYSSMLELHCCLKTIRKTHQWDILSLHWVTCYRYCSSSRKTNNDHHSHSFAHPGFSVLWALLIIHVVIWVAWPVHKHMWEFMYCLCLCGFPPGVLQSSWILNTCRLSIINLNINKHRRICQENYSEAPSLLSCHSFTNLVFATEAKPLHSSAWWRVMEHTGL